MQKEKAMYNDETLDVKRQQLARFNLGLEVQYNFDIKTNTDTYRITRNSGTVSDWMDIAQYRLFVQGMKTMQMMAVQ